MSAAMDLPSPERGEKRKREEGVSETVPMSQSDTDIVVPDQKESVKLEIPHPCDVGADMDPPIHVFLMQTFGQGHVEICYCYNY